MKEIINSVIILFFFFLSSCSFMRTVGLYNIPPNYADTFKEAFGKEFIKHNNDSRNFILSFEINKTEYSPYEEIELLIKIYNSSLTDTMYLYEPSLRGVIVLDSLFNKKRVLEYEATISSAAIVDDYGRRINPTVAPDNFKLPPKDSLITKLSFRTGKKLCNLISCTFTFMRENEPGNYKVYFRYSNEEYDRIKGPILIEIKTQELNYIIRNYTEEELKIRQDVENIISAIENESDSSSVYSLFTTFENYYPHNVYIPKLTESLKIYYALQANKKR